VTYLYRHPFYPSPMSPPSASTSLYIAIPFPKLREGTTAPAFAATSAFAATPARQTQYSLSGFNGNHIKDPASFNFLQPSFVSAPELLFGITGNRRFSGSYTASATARGPFHCPNCDSGARGPFRCPNCASGARGPFRCAQED